MKTKTDLRKKKRTGNKTLTMGLVFLLMFVVCLVISPGFRSARNIMNLLNQNSIYGLMALGMSCCILTGMIDLSAGSIVALVAVVCASVLRSHGLAAGLLAGLAMGTLIGFINGFIISKFKIGYFITTLGMTSICRGAVYIATNGIPVSGVPAAFNVFGMGRVFGFPVSTLIWLGCALILGVLIRYTRAGQYLYAIGGNEKAAWLSGVNVDKIRILAFSLNGFFCAVAGFVLTCRVLMATADGADGYEMTAIASCVVGGMSLSGGKGNVLNAVIGTLIMGLILNILQLMGVSSYWQEAATGFIIILAAGIDVFLSRSKD